MTAKAKLDATLVAAQQLTHSVKVFSRDVGAGLLDVCHNTLALLGLCVLGAGLLAGNHEQLRGSLERHAFDWLRDRHEERAPPRLVPAEPDAVARATALDPRDLPRQQAAVARWIALRYKVAPEPISRLVQEAWQVGKSAGLEPTLILAVMAVESSFNPFAQSPVGAQGLMQVMTHIHDDKYESFGGIRAAFDPVSNLRVGAMVLRECINRAGSVQAGLKYYVGAANHGMDGGYAAKVLAMQSYLLQVAGGKVLSASAPLPVAPSAPARVQVAMPEADAPTTAPAPDRAPSAPAAPVNGSPAAEERVAMLR